MKIELPRWISNIVLFIYYIKHLNKKYYCGHIRWLIIDKTGKNIKCKECGNIANGIGRKTILKCSFNIPYCKSHLSEKYFDKNPSAEHLDIPCVVDI